MRFEVTESDTAIALGSGDVPVLATPRLVAWLEAATVEAAAPQLTPGQTTVGTTVRVAHLRATPVGTAVVCRADPPRASADGRRLTFRVTAVDETGRAVAEGEIERAVVDRAAFVARVARA